MSVAVEIGHTEKAKLKKAETKEKYRIGNARVTFFVQWDREKEPHKNMCVFPIKIINTFF